MDKQRDEQKYYICIDLKSFYASVECVERNLDPFTTRLVVADPTRTSKTICLAVSPALKAYGVPGRARLFEAEQIAKACKVDFITAPPRMALYEEYSSRIYNIYLKYIAPEDTHIYSIDEVFMDVTSYLNTYGLTAKELCIKMMREVYEATGITATGGVGTNLYLAKIAMDIDAKHSEADENGARISELDEMSYRLRLWNHTPITDFWRIGPGYARKLKANGMFTMGDVARCALEDQELLYHLFGVNAELLIDHAFGYEPCTMKDIHSYVPENNSLTSGQVLKTPYTAEKGRLIVREMAELLVLDMVKKKVMADQVVLTVGYDIENLTDPERRKAYKGEVAIDRYGRAVPVHAHGSINLGSHTSSTKKIVEATVALYDRIVDKALLIRRVTIVANHVLTEKAASETKKYEQLSIFDLQPSEESEQEKRDMERERRAQQAVLSVQEKYGKNALLKGMNLEEGAMTIERNGQIGGHKA
ncbi:MAG: DNA methylase [Lachnospiraceae bacterium]|nr:DNA methylase [Lachnospiraceae bacterium]